MQHIAYQPEDSAQGRRHHCGSDRPVGDGLRPVRWFAGWVVSQFEWDCGTLGLRGFMNRKHVVAGISLGLCFGAAFGMALQTLGWSSSATGVGIALGVSLGAIYGAAFGPASDADARKAEARKKVVAEQPLPRPLGL